LTSTSTWSSLPATFGVSTVTSLEVAEALQAHLGAVDRGLRVPAPFELAHLAAQHLVLRCGVALEVDAAHVDALARLDVEGDLRRALLAVDFRHRRDIGEGVADVAEHRDHGCRRSASSRRRENVSPGFEERSPALHLLLRPRVSPVSDVGEV
jgi:hypothetical protein